MTPTIYLTRIEVSRMLGVSRQAMDYYLRQEWLPVVAMANGVPLFDPGHIALIAYHQPWPMSKRRTRRKARTIDATRIP